MNVSTDNVARLADYAAAEKFFENTPHIRGRSDQTKPLGARRQVDTFSISRAYGSDGAQYTCTLYRTPVVTFMPDGEVQVRVYSYTTQSTHAFICKVLTNVSASTHEGYTALSVSNGRFIVPIDGHIRLRRNGSGYYALDQTPQTKLKINRTGTAAVRRKYADFLSYIDGTLAIRKHEGMVHITYGEIGDVLDTTKVDGVVRLDREKYETNWVKKSRNTGMQNLLGMITDKSEDQHKWFYKAFLTLVMSKSSNNLNYSQTIRITGNEDLKVTHSVAALKAHLLDSLYRWHSGWTLTRVTLPLGELGSRKYEHWLSGEDEELA